jgi:hypothetical protein
MILVIIDEFKQKMMLSKDANCHIISRAHRGHSENSMPFLGELEDCNNSEDTETKLSW